MSDLSCTLDSYLHNIKVLFEEAEYDKNDRAYKAAYLRLYRLELSGPISIEVLRTLMKDILREEIENE